MPVAHGVAHVGGLYPTRTDFLTYGVNTIKALGAHAQTIKLWLSSAYATDYPNQTWSTTYTALAGLAADPAFAAVWGDSQITTYLLGTFAFVDGQTNQWLINGCNPTYLAAVKAEIQALCTYLLTNYSGKTFVIQNWEGDWALMGNFLPATFVAKDRCQSMVAWLRARQAGIAAARAAVPSSTSTVLMSVEVNRTLDAVRRVVPDVLPYVPTDLVSISAYECINPAFNTAANMTAAKASIDALIRQEVYAIRAAKPNVPIYIGEYGWPASTQPGFWDMGQAIQQVVDTATALGLVYATWWDVFDNASPYRGYSLYDQALTITPAGTKYQALTV